jgi:hypothetical protein
MKMAEEKEESIYDRIRREEREREDHERARQGSLKILFGQQSNSTQEKLRQLRRGESQ